MNNNQANGKIGGQRTTPRKARASAANGRRGGRPPAPETELSPVAKRMRVHRARKKFFDAEITKGLRKKRA